jgi:cytochrome c-type biogenesis protein CcmH
MRLVALALLLATAPALAQDYSQEALADPVKEAQAVALMDTIRCVVCQGQPISGSNADLAGDMRRLIRERIAAGEKPEQVRAWLISRYGDWVSFKPEMKADTAPLWLIPLLALLGGGWLASRRLKRGQG